MAWRQVEWHGNHTPQTPPVFSGGGVPPLTALAAPPCSPLTASAPLGLGAPSDSSHRGSSHGSLQKSQSAMELNSHSKNVVVESWRCLYAYALLPSTWLHRFRIHTQTRLMGLAYLPIRPGVVEKGSIDRHIWQSHGLSGFHPHAPSLYIGIRFRLKLYDWTGTTSRSNRHTGVSGPGDES